MFLRDLEQPDLLTLAIYHKRYSPCAGPRTHLGLLGPDGSLSILLKPKVEFHGQKGLKISGFGNESLNSLCRSVELSQNKYS